jgi:flagellar protein FliO/FliZ
VIFSYLLTLFGVCGLAVGSLVVLRAAKGGGLSLGAAQPIRVVGRQALGAGANLMLVEVEGRRLLITVSRAGVALLERAGSAAPSVARGTAERSEVPVSGAISLRSTGPLAPLGDEKFGHSGNFSATLKRAGTRW